MPLNIKKSAINIKNGSDYDDLDVFYTGDIANAVSNYLANHPSAFSQYDYVTPEMYGAIGDGVTDDTTAWQSAIDSGKKVRAASKKYKCGTLTVDHDADIDCNNAEFICTEATLFDCYGTSETETTEANYTANSDYSLSDTFTGIVWIVGTNNVFKQRVYYVGGSVEHFSNGILDTQIPIDITDVKAYRLNTVQANIKNIANVEFIATGITVVIKQKYCAYSVIENVNMTNVCYSVLELQQCFKCTYRDSHFDIPQWGSFGNNYYPIGIYDTCYTAIENIHAHCVGWHCISTGSHTLCRGTKVIQCELYSDYAVPAYSDHENGIETLIKDSTLSSAGLGNLGRLINCDIVCCREQDLCHVNLDMSSVDGLGVHIVENCRFYPQTRAYAGIRLYCSPQSDGYNHDYYYNNLTVSNCRNMNQNVDFAIKEGIAWTVTGEASVDTITVINSNIPVVSEKAEHVYVWPEKS